MLGPIPESGNFRLEAALRSLATRSPRKSRAFPHEKTLALRSAGT